MLFREALFVESVAGFVDRAEERVKRNVFVEACSHAEVLWVAAAEGVDGAVHAPS